MIPDDAPLSGDAPPAGDTPVPAPLAHADRIAEILHELSGEIDALGAQLCRDPAFVSAHMEALQAIDLIAQKQRSLAQMLLAECPVSAVAGLGLDELKTRFGHSH